jgi:hypothetical protein
LLLASIANASLHLSSGFLGSARDDLLNSLRRNSEELLAISIDFRNQVKGVKIISCYEQNITSPLTSLVSCPFLSNLFHFPYLIRNKVVDKHTGVLGFPDEVLIPMSGCDHRTACRFSSKDDQNYQAILSEIKGIVG